MELLKSPHVRSFVVGASNYLYKRQKGLSEVLVDVSKFKINESRLYDMATLMLLCKEMTIQSIGEEGVFQSLIVTLCLLGRCSKYKCNQCVYFVWFKFC